MSRYDWTNYTLYKENVWVCLCVWLPMFSVREASPVLNCWILVCMRLARLQRMAGIVWAFLSRGKSLDTHVSWLLQEEKKHLTETKITLSAISLLKAYQLWSLVSLFNYSQYCCSVKKTLQQCLLKQVEKHWHIAAITWNVSRMMFQSSCKWCRVCCFAALPANVPFSNVTKLNQTDPAQKERLHQPSVSAKPEEFHFNLH